MTPLVALWLALITPQAAAPTTPPATVPAATQPSPTTPAAPVKPPCRNPDASGKYHVGCGVTTPTVIYQVEPEFSEAARKQKIYANTMVSFTVDEQGNPTDVHILHSAVEQADKKQRKAALSLDEKALEAVRKYRFSPATYQGKPVPVDLNIEINFQIF